LPSLPGTRRACRLQTRADSPPHRIPAIFAEPPLAKPHIGRHVTSRSAKREPAHQVVVKVQSLVDFNTNNDPYGEHDFGSFEVAGEKFFWKIDYYDSLCEFGSEDPADPEKTTRF
jgi:hypothetical protein